MEGRVAGNITWKSIDPSFTLRAFAESIILLSTLNTPFKVLINTGQKAPIKMMNVDAALNVGSMAMA